MQESPQVATEYAPKLVKHVLLQSLLLLAPIVGGEVQPAPAQAEKAALLDDPSGFDIPVANTSLGTHPWQEELPSRHDALQMARLALVINSYKEEVPGFDFKALEGKTEEEVAQLFPDSDPRNTVIANLLAALPELRFFRFCVNLEDTEAMVVVSPGDKRITVVFRGTSNGNLKQPQMGYLENATRFNFWQVAFNRQKPLIHTQVHKAFYGGSLAGQLMTAVDRLTREHPDFQLFVTGHSLGGALSTIFGFRLAEEHADLKVTVVTFGAPRVGNVAFKRTFNGLANLRMYRFIHHADLVPRVPTLNYRHAGHVFHVDKYAEGCGVSGVHPFKWAQGSQSWKGWPLLGGYSVEDHSMLSYMGAVRDCPWPTEWKPVKSPKLLKGPIGMAAGTPGLWDSIISRGENISVAG